VDEAFAKIVLDSSTDHGDLTRDIALVLGLGYDYQSPDTFEIGTRLALDQTWIGRTHIVGPFVSSPYNKDKNFNIGDVVVRLDADAIWVVVHE
jgi:hypothetical protein